MTEEGICGVCRLPASYCILHHSRCPCHQTKTNTPEEISLLSEPPFTHAEGPHMLKNIPGIQTLVKKPEVLSALRLFPFHSNLPQTSRHVAGGSQRQTSEKHAQSSHS